MKKTKTIIDVVFEDMSVKVFYSDGEVKGLFRDELNEYVYKIAKEETADLNLQEEKQIAHNQMAFMTLFFTGISLAIKDSPFTPVTYPGYAEFLRAILTLASVTYTSVSTFDVLNTSFKKRNIVKTIEIIDEILKDKKEFDREPTFLEEVKLSDTNYEYKKRGLKSLISYNIKTNENQRFKEQIDKEISEITRGRQNNNIIIVESTETEDKPKALVKTL